MENEIRQEIKMLIDKKLKAKNIDGNQRIDMDGGGIYLRNLLFDFAVSFKKQERYKIKDEIKKGIYKLL